MFARLAHRSLHRCMHHSLRRFANTSTPMRDARQSRFKLAKVALGASVLTMTYITWRLNAESHRIALDSPAPSHERGERATPDLSIDTEPSPTETTEHDEKDEDDETTADKEQDQGGSGGAYNPVTGEINWDCPCLGGMAHGPCGPQFKEAFSCFIFSEEEPKGINCVELFKNMQNCFREHPEIYADEIADDDDEVDALPPAQTDDENLERGAGHLSSASSSSVTPSTPTIPLSTESKNI